MHVKRICIATDDPHTAAWVEGALATLDATRERASVAALLALGPFDGADLVIADAQGSPREVADLAERAAASGSEARLLLLVEPEALDGLRLPVRVAADFVVRGASGAELKARVRALLWPGEEVKDQEIVRIGDLVLNLATYQAYLGGEPIEFTYLEYALFAFLATHPNRVYSREVLLRRVWGTDYFGGARTVDVHVRRVRAKLGPELARRLETVRNVGYLWRA